jgi:sulfonate transport system substrate-binding protein
MEIQDRPHRRRGSSLRWMSLIVFFILALSACQKPPEKSVGPPEKITIAYPTTLLSVLYHIAYSNGFFAAEGLEVTPQPHEFGKIALDSMLEKTADLAIVADTPVMLAVTGGREIYTIGVTMTSKQGNAIVARKGRGIAVPADLKGKTIGVPLGTTGDFFLDSFVSTRGFGRKEVNIVDMRPGEMLDALLSGRVDAVSVWIPTMMQLKRGLGDDGVVFYDEDVYSDIACVVVRPVFVTNHPETVRRVLTALFRAETFMKKNPEDSRRLTAEFLKMDQALLDEIWDSFDFRVTLDQSLVVSLEDQTRWAQQNGLTSGTEMPNYLDFIYFDGLQSVKPEAVRIIR